MRGGVKRQSFRRRRKRHLSEMEWKIRQNNDLYTHTPNDKGKWLSLDKHLHDIAEMAKDFANKFKAGDIAYWMEHGTMWRKAKPH
jgi:hypothetical protein